ncbi:MAG: putative asparagine synthetase (glutamine-hydrolyzing) [Actinobacteria bacterium ADurb.Bin444]|nr:MAG: putative asparagine synthetase (glutamine-hydrolyzing) [Actinobacteria bacterium ADurb.Bin444]
MAVWDSHRRCLTLARDHLGVKHLYYGWAKKALVFASELKALRAHPGISPQVDRRALALYLRHSYIPAPMSIYEGVLKLPAGCLLEIPSDNGTGAIRPHKYWSALQTVEQGTQDRYKDDDKRLADRLDSLLRDAVRLRMTGDDSVGAFLSGGVDSSLIVGLMQAQSTQPVKTFTIGFHDPHFNEATHARSVSRHLGTEHTELYVTPGEAMATIPRLPCAYDEPFADSSQIPTMLLAELAGHHVPVALSGDGGDEVFGGYPHYATVDTRWRTYGWCPAPMRRALGGTILALAGDPSKPSCRPPGSIRSRLQLEGRLLAHEDRAHLYREYVSSVLRPTSVVLGSTEPPEALQTKAACFAVPRFYEQMMSIDLVTSLPDDMLTKVERASTFVGLETRMPLLDHRVVELAWRLPFRQKYRHGQGKWILRRILDRYVPREIIERPKMGFTIPVENWLRGELREWADSLLDAERIRNDGYLDAVTVQSWWHAYLRGDNQWHNPLWTVLMFQGWQDRWLK